MMIVTVHRVVVVPAARVLVVMIVLVPSAMAIMLRLTGLFVISRGATARVFARMVVGSIAVLFVTGRALAFGAMRR
ncbi:MAG: hypothetical protein Q4G39_06655, partial [Brachymonas sp.]|nr:hypothetical protein [Brachymonas sp.]